MHVKKKLLTKIGYEVVNIDNIPKESGALLIFYHATFPLDCGLLISKYLIKYKRKILAIVDKVVYTLPGYQTFIEALEHESGSIETCVNTLKRGDLLVIYPGGVREAVLSDSSNYQVCWRNRAGFATVALEAKCVCIKIFFILAKLLI